MLPQFSRATPAGSLPATFAVIAALLLAGWNHPAAADDPSTSIWLIGTRCAPRCGNVDDATHKIRYWRQDVDRQWLPADGEEFFADSDPSVPTIVFVHGNRADRGTAVGDGWRLYRQIALISAGRPIRLVFWSWPSDRIRGRNRRDVQTKAAYSDTQSYYLADWLGKMPPQVPVSLVGYSFGARVITGALHMAAGGQVAGRRLPPREEAPPRSIRVVLVAAALDADWLLPGRRNGLALSKIDRLLITRNRRDPVLKWYPLMYGRRGPEALGYAPTTCGVAAEQIELLDLGCAVGRSHDWRDYVHAAPLRYRLEEYVFPAVAVSEATGGTP